MDIKRQLEISEINLVQSNIELGKAKAKVESQAARIAELSHYIAKVEELLQGYLDKDNHECRYSLTCDCDLCNETRRVMPQVTS